MTQALPQLIFQEFLAWKPEGNRYELHEGLIVEMQPTGKQSGYCPDVLVLNRLVLNREKLWEKYSTVQLAESILLVVEVASTNWRDDYLTKLRDYEEIGIQEYWLVDYLALGGRRYIGNPKQPTISIYHLVDGEDRVSQFINNDSIISSVFPDLNLTARQIFQALN